MVTYTFIITVESLIVHMALSNPCDLSNDRKVLLPSPLASFLSCCSRRSVPSAKSGDVGSDTDNENNRERNGDDDKEVKPSPFLVSLMADCKFIELNATWQHLELE